MLKEMILMEEYLETNVDLHLQIFRLIHYFQLQQIFLQITNVSYIWVIQLQIKMHQQKHM